MLPNRYVTLAAMMDYDGEGCMVGSAGPERWSCIIQEERKFLHSGTGGTRMETQVSDKQKEKSQGNIATPFTISSAT